MLLDQVQERFETQPETVLADAGYCNERDLADLETRGVDGYVAAGREDKGVAGRDLEKHPATGRMVEKLSTPAGRAVYAERKWLSEAPYGWVKHARFERPRHPTPSPAYLAPTASGSGVDTVDQQILRLHRGCSSNRGWRPRGPHRG